jgi:hypothetical protein
MTPNAAPDNKNCSVPLVYNPKQNESLGQIVKNMQIMANLNGKSVICQTDTLDLNVKPKKEDEGFHVHYIKLDKYHPPVPVNAYIINTEYLDKDGHKKKKFAGVVTPFCYIKRGECATTGHFKIKKISKTPK